MTSRGIRNMNPANVRHSDKFTWKGEVYPTTNGEKEFCQFEDPKWGIRAMARILGNYQKIHDRHTVFQMIHRWAPPTENDTAAYTEFVASECALKTDSEIEFTEDPITAIKFMRAMITMENGECPYTDEELREGYDLAWG